MYRLSDHSYKILLLGEAGVGKSALLTRYVDKVFLDDSVMAEGDTITQEFIRFKRLDCGGLIVDLELWDLPPENVDMEVLSRLNAVIFCYNMSDKESFSRLSHWVDQVDKYCSDMVCKVLMGTNSDRDRTVDADAAKELSERLYIPWVETSAKTGSNVRAAFLAVVKELLTYQYPWGRFDGMTIHLDGGDAADTTDSTSVHSLISDGQGNGGLCCVLL